MAAPQKFPKTLYVIRKGGHDEAWFSAFDTIEAAASLNEPRSVALYDLREVAIVSAKVEVSKK